MNELDVFMDRFESRMNALTIPGYEYIVEVIRDARLAVEEHRRLKELDNEHS